MTLGELLAHAGEAFAGAADAPAAFARLAGPAGAWRVAETRPITGVRLGEDEVLVETADPGPAGPLTVGGLLARLAALAADHPDRPVEACEPEVDVGGGVRVRVDYLVVGTGRDDSNGTCLLIGLTEAA